MEFALWTRTAVGQVIEIEFQIKLSVRGVGKYLKRWGLHAAEADPTRL